MWGRRGERCGDTRAFRSNRAGGRGGTIGKRKLVGDGDWGGEIVSKKKKQKTPLDEVPVM